MDEDGKARRNLVLASALVVLAAWLELPLADAVERLLGIKAPGAVNAWRAWAAVLAVQVYLLYRYRFGDEWPRAVGEWRDAFALAARERALRRLNLALWMSARLAAEPEYFSSEFRRAATHWQSTLVPAGESPPPVSMRVDERSLGGLSSTTLAGIVAVVVAAAEPREETHMFQATVSLNSPRVRWPIHAGAMTEALLLSRATAWTCVPIALALLAVFIAAFKTTSALLP